jgi:nucleotidyltransferase AbiEii toxin of type IV toxin-antitoxin system
VEEETPPRTPEQNDLVRLCAALNAEGASYIVVGGMAIIQQGFLRATEDIDLLLENSRENQARVRKALETLPDRAVQDMAEDDLDKYQVVRVADEIVVDLMLSACGVKYEEARGEIELVKIQGVSIPFASAKLLLRTKQTYRDKDIPDRVFLEQKLGSNR